MRNKTYTASDFLKVDEAAQLVGLSHWTVRSWLHKGLLTRYKSASRTVVSRSELLERVRPLPDMAAAQARSLLLSREV